MYWSLMEFLFFDFEGHSSVEDFSICQFAFSLKKIAESKSILQRL